MVSCLGIKNVWRPHPLTTLVVELLQKKGGTATDQELLEMLKEVAGEGVGFRDLNRILLKLEIAGIIFVSGMVRGKRRIELKKKD